MTKKILIVLLAMILCLSVVGLVACGEEEPCTHNYVEGTCTLCGEADPNYQAPCNHNYVDGTCTLCGEADPDYVAPITIFDVAKNGKKGTSYTFDGVVFATDAQGFYLNDTTCSIYVVSTQTVAVGDQVEVTGTLSLEGGFNKPSVTATSATVLASGQTALQPTAGTIGDVQALMASRDNFYKYFTVAGYVTPTSNGYTLTTGQGSTKVIIASESTALFTAWENQQVDVTLLTVNFSTGWEAVVLSAEDIVAHVSDIDEVKEDIFQWVDKELKDSTYVSLQLPTAYALEASVVFTWEVMDSAAITITDNVATINANEDEVATLKLTITSGGKSASQTYDVVVNAAPAKTFAEARELGDAVSKITGTVLTDTHSSGGSRYSVVLFNEEHQLIQVSVANAVALDALSKGDKISAVGAMANDTRGFTYFESVDTVILEKAAADYKTDLTSFNVLTLETQADYESFLVNWQQKVSEGTIVKIVNPYIIYSGNTSYNFIRFGYDDKCQEAYSTTVGEGETAQTFSRIFCFQRDAMEREFPGLDAGLKVPFLNDGAEQRPMVVYAMPLFAGADTLQFSIVDKALVSLDKKAMAETEIMSAFGESISAAEAGVLALPTTASWVTDTIVWTTSHPDFLDVTTGNYGVLTADLEFTLTATYTIDGEQYSTVVTLTAVAKKPVPYTIAEAKLATAEDVAFNGVKGYIAAFGTEANNTTGSSYGGHYFFIYLTDGVDVYVFYPQAWKDSKGAAEPKLGETTLKLYDEIVITGAALDNTDGGRVLTGEFGSVLSSDNTIDYTNLVVDHTITSEQEMVAWTSAQAPVGGVVVKFTGKFYLVGSGSSNGAGCRWQINFKAAESSTAARYTLNAASNANKSLSFKACNGMLIDEWWVKADLPQASGSKCWEVEGTVYAVTAPIWGNTFWALNFINEPAWQLSTTQAQKVKEELKATVENTEVLGTTVDASAAKTITLPTDLEVAKGVVWSIAEPTENVPAVAGLSIEGNVLTVPALTEDAAFVIVATCTVNGETVTYSRTITLKAAV